MTALQTALILGIHIYKYIQTNLYSAKIVKNESEVLVGRMSFCSNLKSKNTNKLFFLIYNIHLFGFNY